MWSWRPAAYEAGRLGWANSRSLTIGAEIVGGVAGAGVGVAGWVVLAGVTGREIGPLLASLVALAVLGGAGACWVPAVAGCVGAGPAGARSALAIEAALTLTGLGTG